MNRDFHHKIVTPTHLVRDVQEARRRGLTIVQCHGCFDIVHPGHIRYLEFARRQGDMLVVTLTGDSEITKGPDKPYIPQELRAENLAALEFVDRVCIDHAPTAEAILRAVRPEVYVKGREYEFSRNPGFLRERELVERQGGRVIFSSGDVVFSSTQLAQAMPYDGDLERHRLQSICGRHGIDESRLANILDDFRGLRVVVAGDTILDRYIFCDVIDVASESPLMSLAQLGEQCYAGGAAIVARHSAAMGAQTLLVSPVAADEATTYAENVLAAEGVETRTLAIRRELVEKTRYLVDETKLLKVEHGKPEPLDSAAEQRFAGLLEEAAEGADVLIFCDFGYGMLTRSLLERVLPNLRRKVGTIAADVSGPHANLLHFRQVDLLCPSEREMRSMLHDFEHGLAPVAWNLLNETQARHLLVTLDKKGLVAFERRSQNPRVADWGGRLKSEHLPSFADRTVDRLGCGDALLTASTLALAVGGGLNSAAYLGNIAAAIEIARLGNIPVEADVLRRQLRRRPELQREPYKTRPPSRTAPPPVSGCVPR
ncbi:MAG: adenylyltransferase/cytidyltransferase family protein [Phycisphaerae bacterium]|nr:adenylyltransferase/cytidyltransferase family protein [Phycisphaerae bacterium]